MFVDLLLIIA